MQLVEEEVERESEVPSIGIDLASVWGLFFVLVH